MWRGTSSGPPGGDANKADADWGAVFQRSFDGKHALFSNLQRKGPQHAEGESIALPSYHGCRFAPLGAFPEGVLEISWDRCSLETCCREPWR